MSDGVRCSLKAWTLTLLRLVTAFLFWQHGAQKLFGWFESEPTDFLTLRWFAGVLEFFGPLFIGFGLFTRPVAVLLAGEMAFAYFLSHHPRGFWAVLNGGERAALFLFHLPPSGCPWSGQTCPGQSPVQKAWRDEGAER